MWEVALSFVTSKATRLCNGSSLSSSRTKRVSPTSRGGHHSKEAEALDSYHRDAGIHIGVYHVDPYWFYETEASYRAKQDPEARPRPLRSALGLWMPISCLGSQLLQMPGVFEARGSLT